MDNPLQGTTSWHITTSEVFRGISLRFEGRELKPYAEPVTQDQLQVGSVYFFVNFVDEEMLVPEMQPVVFVGRDLEPGDRGQVYFQDADSYQDGARYKPGGDDVGRFYRGSENETAHVFEYEAGLDVLLACALRRRETVNRR